MVQSTSRSRRFMISKNSILLLVMLVIIFLAIWAWYTDTSTVSASMTTLSAGESENVELALPEKTDDGTDTFPISNDSWKTELEFKKSDYLKDLVKDVTSDGSQFVVPNFQASTGLEKGREVNIADAWTEALSSKTALTDTVANNDDQYNYISLDFYIRSKASNINVTGDSFLAAGSELGIDENGEINKTNPQIKSLIGKNVYRRSSYGPAEGDSNSFSADAIVGAMRVSLVGAPVASASSGSETLSGTPANKFVWLPRPDVFLKTDNNQNNWRLYKGIKPSGNSNSTIDGYASKSYFHTFYEGNYVNTTVKKGLTRHVYYDGAVKTSTDDDAASPSIFKVSKITSSDSKVGDDGYTPTLGQSANIASGAPDSSKNITFTAGTEAGDTRDTSGYYVYKYTLNIWIEGEDAEARRSMNNGIFSLGLIFGT